MLRKTLGVTGNYNVRHDHIRQRLGVVPTVKKARDTRVRWHGPAHRPGKAPSISKACEAIIQLREKDMKKCSRQTRTTDRSGGTSVAKPPIASDGTVAVKRVFYEPVVENAHCKHNTFLLLTSDDKMMHRFPVPCVDSHCNIVYNMLFSQ